MAKMMVMMMMMIFIMRLSHCFLCHHPSNWNLCGNDDCLLSTQEFKIIELSGKIIMIILNGMMGELN